MNNLSAVAKLLDRESSNDSLREWAHVFSADQIPVEHDYRSILVFRIASEWMGVETTCIEEIAEAGAVRRLPHRTGSLAQGIVSLRGEILVCISLEFLLGLKNAPQDAVEKSQLVQQRLVVCNTEAGKFAFVASEVYGVERYLPRQLRPAPSTISKSSKNYTTGVLTWKDHLTIGCLDTGRLLASIDKGLA